jgi:ATP-dependent DNA helicase RecG
VSSRDLIAGPRPGRFKLIFYKELLNTAQLRKMGLSERQIQAIAYVKEHGSISNMEYQLLAKVSKSTATRDLNLLKDKEIPSSEGITWRGIVYKLKGS